MIRTHNLTLHYGAQTVLDDINLFIGPRDRLALIGRNGAGKTSLMKLLAGQLAPESGDVRKAPNVVVGYFSQDGQVTLGHSVRDELLTAFGELRRVESELRDVEAAMAVADPDDLADLIDRQAALMEDFDRLEGYTVEARIGEILAGLGFETDAADRPTDEFSGGWQMRIALARLLLERPNLLLLDEPTNHLDPTAQAWLVEYLRAYPGAYLAVSHDRAFLDQVVDKTFELEDAKLIVYYGNYSAALAEKKRRRDAQQLAYDRQQKYIARNQRMIERFKSKATRARAAKARERMLSKLNRIEPPKSDGPKISMVFAPGGNLPRQLLEIRDLTFGYTEQPVFEDVSFRVEKGQRLALVGPNGAGKTTMLRLLLKQLEPWRGMIDMPERTVLGYYAQHQAETLDPSKTIFEELTNQTGRGENAIRSVLGRLQLGGDTPHKRIDTLSGGERSRVALAGLILDPANLLLLDEPTNHLDLASKQVLAEALKSFPGAAIIVSHDRAFVAAVATTIGELKDGAFTLYDGDLAYYLEKKGESGDLTAWNEEDEFESAPLSPEQVAREAAIIALEEQLAEVDAQLEELDPDSDSDEVDALIVRQAELVARLAELNEENRLAAQAPRPAEEEVGV